MLHHDPTGRMEALLANAKNLRDFFSLLWLPCLKCFLEVIISTVQTYLPEIAQLQSFGSKCWCTCYRSTLPITSGTF